MTERSALDESGANAADFRKLLEVLPAAAYTCDPSGMITFFNERAASLWGRRPALNDPIDRFCGSFKLFGSDGEPIRHDRCWMALALQENAAYNGHEIVVERPSGDRLTALAHANPIRDELGRVLGAVNILVDITDRKQAEQVLLEANRHKEEFIAMLAHELRTPLAPIMNGLTLLQLEPPTSPDARMALEMIERQLNQLVRLVDDLLDTARISRGKIELRMERVELDSALQAAIETTRPLIEERGHTLVVLSPGQPIHVIADRVRIAQAFANLLGNAAKYTEEGGRISVEVAWRGSQTVVTVRDTGRGIPAELLPHIFDLFHQGPQSSRQGGLGIGLALVREIVAMHGGSVEASSEGPGKGSQFAVHLPRLEGGAARH
jgi:signal transduction histidine kinase